MYGCVLITKKVGGRSPRRSKKAAYTLWSYTYDLQLFLYVFCNTCIKPMSWNMYKTQRFVGLTISVLEKLFHTLDNEALLGHESLSTTSINTHVKNVRRSRRYPYSKWVIYQNLSVVNLTIDRFFNITKNNFKIYIYIKNISLYDIVRINVNNYQIYNGGPEYE